MKIQLSSRLNTIILLMLIFFAPGILALLFYAHPNWLSTTRTNKGELLSPPIKLGNLSEKPQWHLIYWTDKECKQRCLNHLDKLKHVRLALGRRYYQVDEWLVQPYGTMAVAPEMQAQLNKNGIQTRTMSIDKSLQAVSPGIYLASPENFLVLAYKKNVISQDIYHDLKHLLSNSKEQSM